MPRSQRPKKEKATPAGKTATLHPFFGSATQPTPIRIPSTPAEIIIIDSDDENVETNPTLSKRKALNDLDNGGSPSLKKEKLSRNAVQSVPENDSLLKSVPSSSLSCVGTVEGDLYTQTSRTFENWEMGDDEFLDLGDSSQDVGDDPGDILDTCPICGAIFVDFCLSVSITSPPPMGSYSSHPYSATPSARQCLH